MMFKKELQSAAFERLIRHLRERKDVQNIDLMNLKVFAETVYQNGIEEAEAGLVFQILMLESMCMECLILNGKKIPKIILLI